MFRMLQASLYSSSGKSFGVSKKHLQALFLYFLDTNSTTFAQKRDIEYTQCMKKIEKKRTYCGVFGWLAALTNC